MWNMWDENGRNPAVAEIRKTYMPLQPPLTAIPVDLGQSVLKVKLLSIIFPALHISSCNLCQLASRISLCGRKTMSNPLGIWYLFNLKSSLQIRLALFLLTAFPKRFPTAIPILENGKLFGNTTSVNPGNFILFPLLNILLKSLLFEILSALESVNLPCFNPLPIRLNA